MTKYTIKTLQDFEQIPIDRIDDFLKEFGDFLRGMKGFRNSAERQIECPAALEMFVWTDDGKSDISLTVNITHKQTP